VIFVQSRQFCDAKVNASAADLEDSDICLSAALSASIELLLAFVLQIQFESKDVTVAAIPAEVTKSKLVPINNDEILFMIVLPYNELIGWCTINYSTLIAKKVRLD
jgi:hypothetical protein